jgi:polyphosphate kinase
MGPSENIRVISVVGTFLGAYASILFENNGNGEVYSFQCRLMTRNLVNRVETCFPVEFAAARVKKMSLKAIWQTTCTPELVLMAATSPVQAGPMSSLSARRSI